ncbi:hypothetical protein QBC47DRAFT_381741 [Echria macrotheca]|uniref:Uncharacterized protein n=1 Tax=Echria macrotheca TaxID=438768 RepID=A0AAJ0FC07_9PEZI|nr:hypothetical protein QBC47DRAFT_381741 [Echria macrotheca]
MFPPAPGQTTRRKFLFSPLREHRGNTTMPSRDPPPRITARGGRRVDLQIDLVKRDVLSRRQSRARDSSDKHEAIPGQAPHCGRCVRVPSALPGVAPCFLRGHLDHRLTPKHGIWTAPYGSRLRDLLMSTLSIRTALPEDFSGPTRHPTEGSLVSGGRRGASTNLQWDGARKGADPQGASTRFGDDLHGTYVAAKTATGTSSYQ